MCRCPVLPATLPAVSVLHRLPHQSPSSSVGQAATWRHAVKATRLPASSSHFAAGTWSLAGSAWSAGADPVTHISSAWKLCCRGIEPGYHRVVAKPSLQYLILLVQIVELSTALTDQSCCRGIEPGCHRMVQPAEAKRQPKPRDRLSPGAMIRCRH
jgi:hypothetical protein